MAGAEGLEPSARGFGGLYSFLIYSRLSPLGGHIGGHIVVENVRYFTVKCEFRKMIFDKEKARKPLYIKDFRTYLWQGQKDLNPRHAVLEHSLLPLFINGFGT